ncbi:hypothetical protein DL96DRAFT_1575832 [Flagelloscypha sp. PMI_526]|nr:hypothetical protein DL96DRAFT_1575832 [Flagelloscypha sp. PMI_526]
MPLDLRGDIAAAQLAFWVPVAGLCAALVVRYGMRRDAGYLFLMIFALARVAGGALILAGELMPNPDPGAFTAAYNLFEVALPITILSSLGFLGLAGQHTYSEYPRTTKIYRAFGLVPLIGIAIHIAGGVLSALKSGPGNNAHVGLTLRRVAAGIDAFSWVCVAGLTIQAHTHQPYMRSYRVKMLWGVTLAILPLGVRSAYSILEAWSSSDLYGQHLSDNPTFRRMNPISGDWLMYLVLGLVMEYLSAALFLLASLVLGRRRRRH